MSSATIDTEQRAKALAILGRRLEVAGILGITQRGRDQDARFTLRTTGGSYTLGRIDALWSQTEFSKAVAVALGVVPRVLKPAEWSDLLRMVLAHVVLVEESESWLDTVADWVRAYLALATDDQDGAVPAGEPFTRGGELLLTAGGLAKMVRREHGEQVSLGDLRTALRELGGTYERIGFSQQTTSGARRSTKGYYRMGISDLG